MKYEEYFDIMEKRDFTKAEKLACNVGQLIQIVKNQDKHIDQLIQIMKMQNDRIDELTDVVYKIAPEVEMIELLADNSDEEAIMLESYMNHGDYCR